MELRLNISGSLTFPKRGKRWLVVAAERIDGGHVGNVFRFSFASDPEGPYTPAFSVSGVGSRSSGRTARRTSEQALRQGREQRPVCRLERPGSS